MACDLTRGGITECGGWEKSANSKRCVTKSKFKTKYLTSYGLFLGLSCAVSLASLHPWFITQCTLHCTGYRTTWHQWMLGKTPLAPIGTILCHELRCFFCTYKVFWAYRSLTVWLGKMRPLMFSDHNLQAGQYQHSISISLNCIVLKSLIFKNSCLCCGWIPNRKKNNFWFGIGAKFLKWP